MGKDDHVPGPPAGGRQPVIRRSRARPMESSSKPGDLIVGAGTPVAARSLDTT